MKECPICHSVYDDNLNFCVKDGHELINKPVEFQQSSQFHSEGTDKPTPKPKKGGCLKKIIIAAVVMVIGLVAFYRYMMNAATYLRTEPAAVQVTKGGGSCKVEIDYDGYVWIVNHKPEWVDIDENENDFEMSIDPNTTGQIREGSITIQSGKQLAQVLIRQNAFATVMKASESSFHFGRSGGSEDVAVETDGCDWSAQYTNWMKVTKVSDSKLHIQCPSNNGDYRTGTITVKEDNAYVTISISQAGDCNNCHGNGEVSCSSCLGMGSIGYGMFYSSCMWCGGKGKVTCGVCGGSGQRE